MHSISTSLSLSPLSLSLFLSLTQSCIFTCTAKYMYCGLLWFYCEHTSFVQFHMFATGCMQVYRYIDLDVALPWYLTICNDSLYNWILAILLRWIFVGISLGHCGKRFCHKMFFCLIFLRWDVVRISLKFRWDFCWFVAYLTFAAASAAILSTMWWS
jgi:hypothetical protein